MADISKIKLPDGTTHNIKDTISGYITTETDPTVPSWAKQNTKPSYTAGEVGAVATSAVGAASGVAPLNASSKIDSTYLPSYVDDVIEGYYYNNKFWEEGSHTTEIPGEAGKIYVDLTTDKTYRYSGSAFVEISKGGSVVTVSRDLTSGSKVGIVSVDGTSYQLYAPTPPTKTSDLTNDSGFVTVNEAAAAAPVQSVNGQTGAVVLDAEDVGAMSEDATFALMYNEAVSVGSAVVGTAVTGEPNYTPSGIVQTTSVEVLTGGTVALDYTYSNRKLIISGITFTPTKTSVVAGATFQGTGVNFVIEQEN